MIKLSSISKGAQIRAPRIIVAGVPKIGKTTFSCGSRFENGRLVETGMNDPVILPLRGEEGADALEVSRFPTLRSYGDVMDAIGSLYTEDHSYRTAVVDSASALSLLITDDVCKEFGVNNVRKVPGYRTGEAAAIQRWRGLLDGLDALRGEKSMASILIAHIRIGKHKNPEGDDYDAYDFDLDQDVCELLRRWADLTLFANTKVTVKKDGKDTDFSQAKRIGLDITDGQRFLFTHNRPAHPGGGRGIYGQLPYELPLDWGSFSEAVELLANQSGIGPVSIE